MKIIFRILFILSLCTAGGLTAGSAQAQIFCPTTIPGQSGIALSNGTCTNGATGAFSNASLASAALSDLSQSATQETTRTTVSAIADRRQVEEQRCPDGFERVDGACRRPAAAEPARPSNASPVANSSPQKRATKKASREPPAQLVAPTPVYKAVPQLETGVRIASWARVFGDYERRTGVSGSSINCCTAAVAGGIPIPLTLNATSETTSGGLLGGLDFTTRNVWSQGDGIIAGFLVGVTDSETHLSTSSISSNPPNGGNGAATLNARLTGPSVGVFGTYFNGGFSVDNTLKADFFRLNESFTDVLAFTANAGIAPASSTFSNSGSTDLTNLSSFGNLNYKFQLSDRYWIEPTVGYDYTNTQYSSNAALLGLSDGHLLKLQGGARFGYESYWNQIRVTTTLTGLVYDDVIVSGGVVQNGVFGTTNVLLLADQGLLRGQGILAVNFDYGHGLSTFVLADVRGGENLFGAGGKAGVRYQW